MLHYMLRLVVSFGASLSVLGLPATPALPSNPSGRLSVVDWSGYSYQEEQGPGTYSFGYDIEDADSGNVQFRSEQRHANGTVTGSYGFLDADGVVHITHYVADTTGYRSILEKITSKDHQMLTPLEVDRSHPGLPLPGMSLEAHSAAASLDVFKKQKVHEQRTRPKDEDYISYHPQVTNQGPILFKNYKFP